MNIKVCGIGTITPAGNSIQELLNSLHNNKICCEGDGYLIRNFNAKDFLPAAKLRRMSRFIRLAVCSAIMAFHDAQIDLAKVNKDRIGIVVGTVYGSLKDTEEFLSKMILQGEQFVSPINFMNAVHNIAASQIALQLGITGPNLTISNGTASFENALEYGIQLLKNDIVDHVLVCSVDEVIDILVDVKVKLGCWDRNTKLEPFSGKNKIPPGEGACSIIVSQKEMSMEYCSITNIGQYNLDQNIEPGFNPDIILCNSNGLKKNDDLINNEINKNYRETQLISLKHVYGDWGCDSIMQIIIAGLIISGKLDIEKLKLSETIGSLTVSDCGSKHWTLIQK